VVVLLSVFHNSKKDVAHCAQAPRGPGPGVADHEDGVQGPGQAAIRGLGDIARPPPQHKHYQTVLRTATGEWGVRSGEGWGVGRNAEGQPGPDVDADLEGGGGHDGPQAPCEQVSLHGGRPTHPPTPGGSLGGSLGKDSACQR